ncbi:hypothetical protein [Cryobacterium sp. Y82]|uniref:hypothetical protein n=1 Tax=Cryobacterium sp. Y82 TaxID=2045017 RepID=UPI0013050523|nr:hypothetical protein [Cryobacterium sp. Y82]
MNVNVNVNVFENGFGFAVLRTATAYEGSLRRHSLAGSLACIVICGILFAASR